MNATIFPSCCRKGDESANDFKTSISRLLITSPVTKLKTDIQPIFLFSLPRSGSTLSQRILAKHPEISTVTEPCILLPYIYSLKDRGVYAEYGHKITAWGVQDFCAALPNGQKDYLAEVRSLVERLYAKAADGHARYFVDKTPNYSFIANEIIQLFPDAKFIFLWRNPLAIVSSLITMWHGGRWSLYRYDAHLYEGLSRLVEAYEKHADHVHVLHYEKMLANPMTEWQRLFDYLDLPFEPGLIARYNEVRLEGRLGDHVGQKYASLNQEPLEKWKNILANPMRKAWCFRYLRWIGPERLALMGYNMDDMVGELQNIGPSIRFAGSDLWWIPYSGVYRLFEGNIMKRKLRALLSGEHIHIHH